MMNEICASQRQPILENEIKIGFLLCDDEFDLIIIERK
jgi:hypothetical protein